MTIPVILLVSLWFFKSNQGLRRISSTEAILPRQEFDGRARGQSLARQDYEKKKFEKDNWGKYLGQDIAPHA